MQVTVLPNQMATQWCKSEFMVIGISFLGLIFGYSAVAAEAIRKSPGHPRIRNPERQIY